MDTLHTISKIVITRKAPIAGAMQVISVGIIVSNAQVIADTAGSQQGEGRNDQRIVNSNIDVVTWSNAYN
jgi:hypothetical protein